jgi:hypothetical protein
VSEEPNKDPDDGEDKSAREVEALKTKNAELVGELRKLSERLSAFGDLTPEKAAEAARKAREAEDAKLTAAGQFEELKKRLQEEHRKEVEALRGQVGEKDARLERLLVQNELDRALDEVGVLPDRKEYVRRYFLADGPKVKDDRGVFERSDGDVAISEAVKKWAEGQEADPFVKGDAKNGGGSRNASGAGDAKRWGTMTATEQAMMFRTNPEQARRMAAEAGVKLSA